MSERKLASIQVIEDLRPIEGADAIEVADVLGWHVVVKKGEFKIGDLCVYVEIDSLLPEREEFEFMRDRHFKVKTIKLRGQVSQGICFPYDILPEGVVAGLGEDVTEVLGIVKWEPAIPACLHELCRSTFPGWMRKTNEERIQSCKKEIFNRPDAHDPVWIVTEKLDGTSFTVALHEGSFHVCSHNMDLKLEGNDDNLYIKVAHQYGLDGLNFPAEYAVQGEILAPGVQKNKYQVTEPVLRVFNVFDIAEYEYLPLHQMEAICRDIELQTVPILDRAFALPQTVDELVEYAQGPSIFNPKLAQREGVVIRHRNDSNISFKVINPKFLLKWDE